MKPYLGMGLALLMVLGGIKIAPSADAAEIVVEPLAAGGVEIAFTLDRPGQVSLAVYAPEERLLRTLLSARPLGVGRHAVRWDGLDRDGAAPPPGDYSVKLLKTNGLRSELAAQVGINPVPFWEEGVGNHAPTAAIAVDPEGIILVSNISEGGFGIAKIRADRSYVWSGIDTNMSTFKHNFILAGLRATKRILNHYSWGHNPCGLATVGGVAYMLRNNGTVHGTDSKTGRKIGKLWSVQWNDNPDDIDRGGVQIGLEYMDMDAHGDVLVVSYRRHDAVRLYDLKTGTLKSEVKGLKEPLGVAVGGEGDALVISDGAIVRIKNGRTTPFIPADALTAPWRLSLDRNTNELLVAENSTATKAADPHHQVKRFAPTGQLMQTYGIPKGRQDGLYVATDFKNIIDIAADGKGGFFVAEPSAPPIRVARFGRDGQVLMEFFGAPPYGSLCAPEHGDPRHVWYSTGSGLVRAEVDYEAKSWRVLEIYSDSMENNIFINLWGHRSKGLRAFEAGGRTYVATLGNTLFVYDRQRHTVRPSNANGIQWTDIDHWLVPPELRGSEKPLFHIRTSFLWSDRNDDGLPSLDEMSLYNAWYADGPAGDAASYGEDLSVTRTAGQVIAPTLITAAGTPVYEAENMQKLGIGSGRDIFQSGDGHWYKTISDWGGPDVHGIYWYPGLSSRDRLIKYDADFQEVWSIGRHSATWDREPGWSHRLEGISGETHGCIVVDGNFVDTEQIGPMVWTEDGLFVDELLVNPGGNLPEWVYYGSRNENSRGVVIDDPKTGDVLFFAHGNSALPIWRITGWENWQRSQTAFRLPKRAPHAALEGTGLQAEYFANPDWEGQPAVSRIDERAYFDWEKTAPADGVPQRGFSARWTGSVEAPLSETFIFVVRTGSHHARRETNPVVRLWIDGSKIIDATLRLGVEPRNYNREYWRAAVPMQAGRRYAVKLEYGDRGGAGPKPGEANYAHLCWESPSIDRRSIEAKHLYPNAPPAREAGAPSAEYAGDPRTAGRLMPVNSEHPQTCDADGMIGHLTFNETDGLVAGSQIGAGVRGTLHGRASWVPGRLGNALRFDGGMCSIVPELRMPHSNYTIAFSFKTAAASARLASVNRKSTLHDNYHESIISMQDGKLQVRLSREVKGTENPYNDDAWHHVALVVEKGKGFTLYVDGETATKGATDEMGTWHLWHVPTERLGMRIGPGDGSAVVTMDDLRIYELPLDEPGVKALHRQ